MIEELGVRSTSAWFALGSRRCCFVEEGGSAGRESKY